MTRGRSIHFPSPAPLRRHAGDAREFVLDFLRFGGRRAAGACALVAIGTLVEGFSLVLIIPLLDVVSGSAAADSFAQQWLHRAGLNERLPQLGAVLLLFGLGMTVRSALLARRDLALSKLEIDYLNDKQAGLIKTLSQAPWTKVSRLRHARITHLLSQDVYRVGQAASGILESVVAVITLAIQFGLAFWLNPILTLAAFGFLLIGATILAPLFRAARQLGEFATASHLSLLNDASQFLGALKLAVSQNLQQAFVAQFTDTIDALAVAEVAYVRRRSLMHRRLTTMAVLAATATAFIGFGLLDVKSGTLLALLLVLSRMSGPATHLMNQALEAARCLPAYRQLEALKAELASTGARPVSEAPAPFGDIVFENVGYAHAEASDAVVGLASLSLTIPKGAFIGVAGPSGAGKTTFADLLVGLVEPQSGSISINGRALNLPALTDWREHLSYVSQDPFLSNDTIRRNLLWAAPAATEVEIAEAITISGAAEIVERMPAGLDTVVGERGSLVSGGERQRLAIARALLRKPRLLILDEATNAIDVAGERRLLERLAALRPSITLVMIAHRLESLSLCDKVVIVENGRVAAAGSFTDLKARLVDMAVRLQADPPATRSAKA